MIHACGDDARAVNRPGRPRLRRRMAEQAPDRCTSCSRLAEPTEPVTKAWIGPQPRQPGHVDGGAHAAAGADADPAAAHRHQAQDPRAGPRVRGLRRDRLAARHPDGRGLLRPDHGQAAALGAGRAAAPVDAGRWRCSARYRCCCSAGSTPWRASALLWVLFSAFQNGEYASLSAAVPGPRAGQSARDGGRLGRACRRRSAWCSAPAGGRYVFDGTYPAATWCWPSRSFVLTLPFVLLTPDHPLEPEHREPLSAGELLGPTGSSPRRHPDFAWAWITRFLASLAIGHGHAVPAVLPARPGALHAPAQDGLFILIVIYTVMVVIVTAIVGGVISDRIGKRKMIVTVSGIADGRRGAAADVRRDLGRGDRRRRAVRRRVRRLPGGRPGADHPGAARRPGTGPRTSASSTSRSSARPRSARRSRRCWSSLGGYPLLFGGHGRRGGDRASVVRLEDQERPVAAEAGGRAPARPAAADPGDLAALRDQVARPRPRPRPPRRTSRR